MREKAKEKESKKDTKKESINKKRECVRWSIRPSVCPVLFSNDQNRVTTKQSYLMYPAVLVSFLFLLCFYFFLNSFISHFLLRLFIRHFPSLYNLVLFLFPFRLFVCFLFLFIFFRPSVRPSVCPVLFSNDENRCF